MPRAKLKEPVSFEPRVYKLTITFIEPILGTQPQRDVASEYIASKFEDNGGELPEDESETLQEEIEKGTTVFHRLNDEPILYDYQIKGFFKSAGKVFNGVNGVFALRQKMDDNLFVRPRRIKLNIPEGGQIEYLERPLRAETAQGPRVALARSEMLPVGTWIEFEIEVFLGHITEEILIGVLNYGANKGIGQWRNGGYGAFEYTIEQVK